MKTHRLTIRMGAAHNGLVCHSVNHGLLTADMHRPPEPLRKGEAPQAFEKRNGRFLKAQTEFARDICNIVGIREAKLSVTKQRKPRRKVPNRQPEALAA